MEVHQEPDILIQAATEGIKELLAARGKENFTDVVDALVENLQAQEMNFSLPQQQTAGGIIVISARVLLPHASQTERLALIPLFRQGLDMISSFDKLPLFTWKNAEPLFHLYLNHIPRDVPSARQYLQFLVRMLDVIRLSSKVKSEMFSFSSVLTIARIIQTTFPFVEDSNQDSGVRKHAFDVLSRIVYLCPPENAPSVSIFISGILGNLLKVLQAQNVLIDILENSIHLFTDAVVLVFADDAVQFDINQVEMDSIHPEMRNVFLNQTPKWKEEGLVHICDYIHEILGRYMFHRMFPVKRAAYRMVIRIQETCSKVFGEKLYRELLFLFTRLRFSEWDECQKVAKTCLDLVKNKQFAEQYFYEQLDHHIRTLPVKARRSEGSHGIRIVCSLLDGIGDGVRLMCTTGSESIELLLRSLADCVVIEKKRLMITSSGMAETPGQALRRMEIGFDLRHGVIEQICRILATLGGVEVIDMVHNMMRIETLPKQTSYQLILGYLLSALNPDTTPPDDPIILMLAEYLTAESNRLYLDEIVNEVTPGSRGYDIDWETCLQSLGLTNIALCMKFIGSTANRSNVSINCLCTILSQTFESSYIVTESAQFALKYLAEIDTHVSNENELVQLYSSHILHRVSMACSHPTDHFIAPFLLQGYMNYASVREQFDVIKVIVEKMLYVLDKNKQRHCHILVLALLQFLRTMVDEYPNQEPLPPPIDSEDEKPLPTPQHLIAEKILLRTKHLVYVQWLPVKVAAIKIITAGVEALRFYDDLLLPLIHQNWQGLMNTVKEQDPITLSWISECVAMMAQTSGSFVHQKILKEFWPLVGDWLLFQVTRSDDFESTTDFRTTLKFIQMIHPIVTYSGMTEEEANETFMKILDTSIENQGKFASLSAEKRQKIIIWYRNRNSNSIEQN